MSSNLDEILAAAELAVRRHRPVEGAAGVCPICTRLGVGDGQGPVGWPCAPYEMNRALLQRHGRRRPLPEEDPE